MHGLPTHKILESNGTTLSYYEWGNAKDPTILLLHATGFHARVWDQTIKALPEGFHIIAADMRGHGRSAKLGLLTDWRLAARDIAILIEHLGLTDMIGVGHSMGAHSMAQLAAKLPDRFRQILLIDPVIMAADYYSKVDIEIDVDGHPIARRRNDWASPKALFERLSNRHPYTLWDVDALHDYCDYGVLPNDDDEGYSLACAPRVEASVYAGSLLPTSNIYGELGKVEAPVTVLRAKTRKPEDKPVMDFSLSPTWPGVAGCFKNGTDIHLPELSHFIPMQAPERTAGFILDCAG